ncbi:MAG: hypothetical protein IPN49_08195 [Saprospiraceae bacterium]|nr:hypothetical protein [Saprospiraceae bacterium]
MDNEKMTEVISQTLEKLEREKYMKRISELEYFPFKSLSEVREKLSKRKINFHIYSDPHFINKFGSAQSKTINKIIRTVQNLIIIATYIFPLVLAINNSNFLYLFCLPIIYFAILKTTPSLYRPLFSLTSIILLVISFLFQILL